MLHFDNVCKVFHCFQESYGNVVHVVKSNPWRRHGVQFWQKNRHTSGNREFQEMCCFGFSDVCNVSNHFWAPGRGQRASFYDVCEGFKDFLWFWGARVHFVKTFSPSGSFKFSVMPRLLRWRFWKSGPWREPPMPCSLSMCSGDSIFIAFAPESYNFIGSLILCLKTIVKILNYYGRYSASD